MFVLVLIITFYFYSAIASALAKQEAILSQLHEDLNAYTDNVQVRHLFHGGTSVYVHCNLFSLCPTRPTNRPCESCCEPHYKSETKCREVFI